MLKIDGIVQEKCCFPALSMTIATLAVSGPGNKIRDSWYDPEGDRGVQNGR
jgi:hypothetical protein